MYSKCSLNGGRLSRISGASPGHSLWCFDGVTGFDTGCHRNRPVLITRLLHDCCIDRVDCSGRVERTDGCIYVLHNDAMNGDGCSASVDGCLTNDDCCQSLGGEFS